MKDHLEKLFKMTSTVDYRSEDDKLFESLKQRKKQVDASIQAKKEEETSPWKHIDGKMPKDTLGQLLWVEEEIYSLWLKTTLNFTAEKMGDKLLRKRKLKIQLEEIKQMKEENDQIKLKVIE